MEAVRDLMLVARSGPVKGARIEFNKASLTVGRDNTCDIKLDDPKVSRIHGIFEVRGTDVYYRDNNSTNGSNINGRKISVERLSLGDLIQLGSTEFALLEHSDFQTIQFVASDTMVTQSVKSASVSADALADKFASIFDYYRDHQPEASPIEQVELVKTQKLLGGLKTLYAVTKEMSQLLPLDQLLKVVAKSLFEVFAGAENLVILLWDDGKSRYVPKHLGNRNNEVAEISISTTVLRRAVDDRATIVANDIGHDERFSASESLVGFAVKSVICAPLVVGEKVVGALYLDNRQAAVTYDDLDVELVTAFANQAAIAIDNARLSDTLQQSYHQMLQALVRAIEAKDPYTMGHTQRVKEYTLGIAEEMNYTPKHLERIGMSADLHDIGKIGVKEGIINKPGNLSDTEYSSIKMHVEMGEKILAPITYLQDLLPWVRGHHEKYDGSGYPDGLKGTAIAEEARILAVADSFDAMTSKRSYNSPLTFEQGLGRVQQASGTHFDPKVVQAFERYLRKRLANTKSATADKVERPATHSDDMVCVKDSPTSG